MSSQVFCASDYRNGILFPKLCWPTVRTNCASDWDFFLKLETEGQEFAKILRSLEQFVQTVKGQNNFWWQNAFLTCSWKFLISNKLEQVELEKLLGFRNMQVRKYFFFLWFFTELQCSVQFKPCTHHRHKSNNNGFKVIINSYCFNEISF